VHANWRLSVRFKRVFGPKAHTDTAFENFSSRYNTLYSLERVAELARRARTPTSTGTRRHGQRVRVLNLVRPIQVASTSSAVGSVQHGFGCQGAAAPHNLDCAGAKTMAHIRYSYCGGIDPAVFSHNLDCVGAKAVERLNRKSVQTPPSLA
jgi:hypothetical protein